MPKLRKMLGGIDTPETIALMRLIETQSVETLAKWAVNYAQSRMLPIAEKHGGDARLNAVIAAAEAKMCGAGDAKSLRAAVGEARKAAQEAKDPTLQAAARAISTACAVFTTPTNSLGFTFYAQAAFAYDEAGIDAPKERHDLLAQQENTRLLAGLQAVAVDGEEKPAKIDWNC